MAKKISAADFTFKSREDVLKEDLIDAESYYETQRRLQFFVNSHVEKARSYNNGVFSISAGPKSVRFTFHDGKWWMLFNGRVDAWGYGGEVFTIEPTEDTTEVLQKISATLTVEDMLLK